MPLETGRGNQQVHLVTVFNGIEESSDKLLGQNRSRYAGHESDYIAENTWSNRGYQPFTDEVLNSEALVPNPVLNHSRPLNPRKVGSDPLKYRYAADPRR